MDVFSRPAYDICGRRNSGLFADLPSLLLPFCLIVVSTSALPLGTEKSTRDDASCADEGHEDDGVLHLQTLHGSFLSVTWGTASSGGVAEGMCVYE